MITSSKRFSLDLDSNLQPPVGARKRKDPLIKIPQDALSQQVSQNKREIGLLCDGKDYSQMKVQCKCQMGGNITLIRH
jgi:hypothetical protein